MDRFIIGSLWDRINRNGTNANFEYLFEGRQKIDELNNRAESILTEAETTNNMNKDVQRQLDGIILENGNSEAEVVQARGSFPLLKDRLIDTEKVFRWKRGTAGDGEEAVNTIIGYKDNDVVSGIRGAHVQQGSKFNENIVGGDPSTIGKYEQNVVDTNITNAHYALIGGYDNVNNALAGLVISMHSYISELSGHGAIYGGSFNEILDGDYSGIFGGALNKIQGTDGGSYSTIFGGNRNTINAKMSGIVSGMSNRIGQVSAQTEYAGIYNSYNSTVDGRYALVLGGNGSRATKDYSMARGIGAVANNVGESVFTTGRFKNSGDSGQSVMHLMRQTDTGFETQLLPDITASNPITAVGVNTILKIRGDMVGFRVDAEGGASFSFEAVLYRASGKLELKSVEIKKDWAGDDLYNINVGISSSGSTYEVRAKGINGHIINWTCRLETVWSRNI